MHMSCKLRLSEFHLEIRSSLHADSQHYKLKLMHTACTEQNSTNLQVRVWMLTRTCTGNSWNFYEFHPGTRNSVVEYSDSMALKRLSRIDLAIYTMDFQMHEGPGIRRPTSPAHKRCGQTELEV